LFPGIKARATARFGAGTFAPGKVAGLKELIRLHDEAMPTAGKRGRDTAATVVAPIYNLH